MATPDADMFKSSIFRGRVSVGGFRFSTIYPRFGIDARNVFDTEMACGFPVIMKRDPTFAP